MRATRPIENALRSVRRAQHILSTFVRFGFRELIVELDLHRLVRGGRAVLGGSPKARVATQPEAVRVRLAIQELGPTFIKLGQILSTRPDMIPADWAKELKRLQSDIPPVDFEEVEASLNSEFRGGWKAVFRSIEPTPIAAASIAQVHRAVLLDGTPVVVKVLRPGIRKVIDADMEILRVFAGVLEKRLEHAGYSASEVVNQFAEELERETDLEREGRNAERMARDFAHHRVVRFPRVFWEATTDTVLTMEEAPGTVLSRTDLNDFTEQQRHDIAVACADMVFRQCLELGFFHADPHPGNIFIETDPDNVHRLLRDAEQARKAAQPETRKRSIPITLKGETPPAAATVGLELPKPDIDISSEGVTVSLGAGDNDEQQQDPTVVVTFIDCGMTGQVEPRSMEQIAAIVHGALTRDIDDVLEVVIQISDAEPQIAQDRRVRADTWRFLDRFGGGSLGELRMGELLNEFFALLRRHQLRCPADVVHLIKAITTIEGVGEEVAPDFDIVAHVRPYIEHLVKARYGPEAVRKRTQRAARNYAEIVEDAPNFVRDAARMFRRKQIRVNVELDELDRLTDVVDHAARNIAHAVFVAGILIGSTMLLVAAALRDGSGGWIYWLGTLGIAAGICLVVFRAVRHRWWFARRR